MFPDLPDERFDIIYADPPWKYDMNHFNAHPPTVTGPWAHYPVLGLDELKSLDVQSISCNGCVLFLWSTGPLMDWAIELGNCWGFTYDTVGFVWDKMHPTPGYYTLATCELVLVFRKDKVFKPVVDDHIEQFLTTHRTVHSVKPDEIRRRIELMFPKQKKIELFARTINPGWTVWGNESEQTVLW